MDRREHVSYALADCVARLDTVLRPWGFVFVDEGCKDSHTGPFASGHYIRVRTWIRISCRDTIDNIFYEHSFMTEHPSWRATETFTINHAGLMRALGHPDDCHLIVTGGIPDAIAARHGGDPMAALIHDLSTFAAPILREPTDVFCEAIRCGHRSYTVAANRGDE